MNKKRRIKILITYCCFFILLLSSTQLVLLIPHEETFYLRKIEPIGGVEFSDNIGASIESVIQNQDIMFTVEIRGYAFPQNQELINDKAIKLVFSSEENQYEVETEILDRFELRSLFNEKGIKGIDYGFVTRFSPLSMKNGVYKLTIYFYAGEEVFGVFNTGRTYKKGYRFFNEIKGSAQSTKSLAYSQ